MIKSNDGINITRGTIVMNGSTRMRFYEQESSNLERKRRKYDIRMSSEYFRKGNKGDIEKWLCNRILFAFRLHSIQITLCDFFLHPTLYLDEILLIEIILTKHFPTLIIDIT
jgi:hypothetical protein